MTNSPDPNQPSPGPDPNQPPPGQQYPPPGQQYPPPGQQYPPPGQQYPPPGQQYPPPGPPPYGSVPLDKPGYAPPPGSQPGPPLGPPAQPPYGGYPPAPAAPPGAYYTPGDLHLPPGVELASIGRRIGAYFLAIPLVIITLGIGYIIWGLVLWAQGTTPALKVLGMKCYRVDNGQVPRFWRMALREVIGRICENILGVITQLISFIMFLSTDRRQALHDVIASTTVVYDPNKVLG